MTNRVLPPETASIIWRRLDVPRHDAATLLAIDVTLKG